MKVRYDKQDDVLMIELVKRKIDDAYEVDDMIVHVDKDKVPVLLEIFKATKLLQDISEKLPHQRGQKTFGI